MSPSSVFRVKLSKEDKHAASDELFDHLLTDIKIIIQNLYSQIVKLTTCIFYHYDC